MNALTSRTTRTAVSVTGLLKTYGEKIVLDGVDLTIAEADVFALLGPNGAGKTTIVRILSTLIPADAGTATVLGYDLSAFALLRAGANHVWDPRHRRQWADDRRRPGAER